MQKLVTNFKKTPIRIDQARNNRLPPSSIQSFLEEEPDIPSLLITDHNRSFTNMYYNSLYDDTDNLNYSYINITEELVDSDTFSGTVQEWIANISNAVAKTLYEEVYNETYQGDQQSKPYIVSYVFYINL